VVGIGALVDVRDDLTPAVEDLHRGVPAFDRRHVHHDGVIGIDGQPASR
jgi:hypothetical protein